MNTPLDPLADFRPDGYGLDEARRARMRARVLDAIPDDPAPAATVVLAPVATAAAVDPTGARTLEVAPGSPEVVPPAARRHWSTGRRLLVAASVAVAIGLLAVVAGTSRPANRQVGTADEPAAMSLRELAEVAAAQPDRPLAPGEYQYLESTQADRREGGGLDLTVDRNWHTVDGSGRRQTVLSFRPQGAQPGSETDVTIVPFVDDDPGYLWFGPFTYDLLRSASTDPNALQAAAAAAMPGQPEWAVAEQVANLEALTVTAPNVRAAGLRLLATLDYQPIGAVTDPFGRAGVGFQADTPDGIEILAFDPSTGRALGYWRSPAGTGTSVDAATQWMAWGHDEVTQGTS